MIDWFKIIKDRKRFKFVQFDTVEFFPSITENLLILDLEFAQDFINISDDNKRIILQAKQSILYKSDSPLIKKGDKHFDVTMGSLDGAETCKLVGLFLLSKLQNLGFNLGLYQDDGLGVCTRQVDKLKKEMCTIFGNYDLKITIDVNHKLVNFLDVNFGYIQSSSNLVTVLKTFPFLLKRTSKLNSSRVLKSLSRISNGEPINI